MNNLLGSSEMMAWLSSFDSFEDYQENMLEFCEFAYGARTAPYMKELKKRSGNGFSLMQEESRETKFLKLRHYIGRLGSHMSAAKILVAAAMRFPQFFDNFEIKCLESSKPDKSPPPTDHKTTLDSIIGRMLKNENRSKLSFYQDALHTMDTKFQIFRSLKTEYKKFFPRVHAELILLEYFYWHQFDFVDGDKYIACSKPACYCCYHYISVHPGNFARPACHNKTYIAWRPPDVELVGDKHRRDMANKVVENIRSDVLEQIEKKSGRRRTHPDSTTGITPSVAIVS